MLLAAAILLATALQAGAVPAAAGPVSINSRHHDGRMENLVTFGDSLTDEGRYDYFVEHHAAPPVGAMLPASNHTSSGGPAWGRLVANATGANYYNYAVSGAQCTNDMDVRSLDAIGGPFPSVLEYQIPVFEQDVHHEDLYPRRRADNTVYALWIGTNDVGIVGVLGGKNKPGTTLSTFMGCVWDVLDRVYRAGGRRFVLLNMAPLEHAPMYAAPGDGGAGNHQFWLNKTAFDVALYAKTIREYTTSINTMYRYGVPSYALVEKRWKGASVALFDVHALMMDVIAASGRYLDEPVNARAPYRTCLDGCVDSKERKTSFMWYDEIHPSERMQTVFAKHFIDVVRGRSEYGTYYR